MKCIENDCVDCGLPCFDNCPYKRVPHYYCDECNEEGPLYYLDGQELCEHCLLEKMEKVEESWN